MGRRFLVDSVTADDTGRIDIRAVRRHLDVVRVGVGDTIYLFDGNGAEVRAEIMTLDRDEAVASVRESITNDSESPLECWLVQALPARPSRMDTIIRQVTELGVARVVPVVTERSQQAKAKAATMHRRTERWRRIAVTAAEQSGRTRVPSVDLPCALTDLEWERLPAPLLMAEPTAGPVDRTAAPDRLTLLVGPEGGWTEAELALAREAGARPFSLGPRVLRADTAGAAALSLLQFLWGDLG